MLSFLKHKTNFYHPSQDICFLYFIVTTDAVLTIRHDVLAIRLIISKRLIYKINLLLMTLINLLIRLICKINCILEKNYCKIDSLDKIYSFQKIDSLDYYFRFIWFTDFEAWVTSFSKSLFNFKLRITFEFCSIIYWTLHNF